MPGETPGHQPALPRSQARGRLTVAGCWGAPADDQELVGAREHLANVHLPRQHAARITGRDATARSRQRHCKKLQTIPEMAGFNGRNRPRRRTNSSQIPPQSCTSRARPSNGIQEVTGSIPVRSTKPSFPVWIFPQVAESGCGCGGSNKAVSAERNSLWKEQLLEPLALLE